MLAGLAVWVVLRWLPNDELAIRAVLTDLAETASVSPDDSGFARLAYGDRLASFFTTNAALHVESFGGEFSAIGSRSELIQSAMAARTQLRQAEFKVAGANIQFPEKGVAKADVVITGEINFQTNQFGQAFRMRLQKAGGRWLIHEVRSVERLQ